MVRNSISIDTTVGSAPVRLADEACLHLAGRGFTCDACVAACPIAILSFADRTFAVGDACVACGRCAAACPTEALSVAGFPPVLPDAATPLRLECRRVPGAALHPDSTVVPCLGGLTVNQLLDAYDAGERPVVAVDRGWCGGCPAGGPAPHGWIGTVAAAAELLARSGVPGVHRPQVAHEPLPAAQALPLPPARPARRSLFAALRRRAATPAPEGSYRPRLPQGGAAAARPRLQRHRLQTLTRIAARPGHRLPSGLLPALSVSDDCDDAGICVALCPTAALRRSEGAGRTALVFHGEDCIACGRCMQACPNRAIRLDAASAGGGGTVTLITHMLAECQCGARFVARPGVDFCARCRTSRELARSAAVLMRRQGQSGEQAGDAFSQGGKE